MLEVGNSGKLGLLGDQDDANSVFFFKNDSIYARKQGDFVSAYESRYNTVYGVNGPSFTSNSDYNTAVGYQSANNQSAHSASVFLGAGIGYDVKAKDSILLGKKDIVLTGTDTVYEYDGIVAVGTDNSIHNAEESVIIGNLTRNQHTNVNRRVSRNVIIGHGNINNSNDSMLVGYKNKNEGKQSVLLGKNIKNTGDKSLILYPRLKDGSVPTEYINDEDNHINIFGVISGNSNNLSINGNVSFEDDVAFGDLKASNLDIASNIVSDGSITSAVNITSTLSTNTANVSSDVSIGGSLSVKQDIFIRGSNLTDVIRNTETNATGLIEKFRALEFEQSVTKQDIREIDDQLVDTRGSINNNYNTLSNLINDNGFEIQQNRAIIDNMNETQRNLELYLDDTIGTQIDTQFNSIIQKAIDGTYVFNIVRDSLTKFPSFLADITLSNYEKHPRWDFEVTQQPNLDPANHIFGEFDGVFELHKSIVENEEQSIHTRFFSTCNVIFSHSNVFRNRTMFSEPVVCSNNLALNSNLFIGGVLQSFSNQIVVNDNLLVHEALHVTEFIQTNAIKADHNFNNYVKVFSNLSFSNDWRIFTSNNPNNSNLRDLVIKGTHEGSEGIETHFTDFMPGQLNFTGQHRCSYSNTYTEGLAANDPRSLSGYIVCSTGEYCDLNDEQKINIDDAIPIVELSRTAKDKRAFGVISSDEDSAFPDSFNKRSFQIGTLKFRTTVDKRSTKIIVNSVGEGGIWVCDANGPIKNGDLIVTSDVPGLGQRQEDDILRSYTVAKATCDADFSKSSKAFIGCTYKF